MKRRVQRWKNNKKVLRHYQAACGAAAPFTVLLDASLARCISGEVANVSEFVQEGFAATCHIFHNHASVTVLERTMPEAARLLKETMVWNASNTDGSKNEVKAIKAVLDGAKGLTFVGTQSHDVRKAIRGMPNVACFHVSLKPAVVRLDAPVAEARGGAVLGDMDAAFMRKLQRDKLLSAEAVRVPEPKRPAPVAEPTEEEAAAAAAAEAEAPKKKKRRTEKGINPLAMRKKKVREVYVSADSDE
jgi:hypothetical protein